MSEHRTQRGIANGQVEIVEQPYRQHMEHPLVEVTVWESIEDGRTILFEETDPARQQVEPAGRFLGTLPRAIVVALEDAGYDVCE
jgi:hypothetical protein